MMHAPSQGMLTCDPDQGLDFLRKLRPHGPWALTGIVPDGATITNTFLEANQSACREFIRTNNAGGHNMYYTINPVRNSVRKKPTKAEILGAEFAQVDADPTEGESSEAFKARFLPILQAFIPAASFVIDSGNGVQ